MFAIKILPRTRSATWLFITVITANYRKIVAPVSDKSAVGLLRTKKKEQHKNETIGLDRHHSYLIQQSCCEQNYQQHHHPTMNASHPAPQMRWWWFTGGGNFCFVPGNGSLFRTFLCTYRPWHTELSIWPLVHSGWRFRRNCTVIKWGLRCVLMMLSNKTFTLRNGFLQAHLYGFHY